jgi:hypothetical protein
VYFERLHCSLHEGLPKLTVLSQVPKQRQIQLSLQTQPSQDFRLLITQGGINVKVGRMSGNKTTSCAKTSGASILNSF